MAIADRLLRQPAPTKPAGQAAATVHLLSVRQRMVKRALDVTLAGAGLLFLWPLMLVVGLAVRVSSPGPAIYRHQRVGRHGTMFSVLKFRTMSVSPSQPSWQITVAGDSRVTRVGRWLRSSKIDELPQLWNVLRGEMSLVGWRPHVAGYPDLLSGPEAAILNERPGITGAATLYFRQEEHLLALHGDPKRYYDDLIYPTKVSLDLEYYRTWTLGREFAHLIVTVLPRADRWLGVVPSEETQLRIERELQGGQSQE